MKDNSNRAFDQGNYKSYYKIRNDLDSRINLLDKKWFYNKLVLDIGCNKGIVDIEIASKYLPKLIVGIDVDPLLIDHAKSHLKRLLYDCQKSSSSSSSRSTSVNNSNNHQSTTKPSLLFIPRSVAPPKNSIISSKIVNNVINNHEDIPIFPNNIQFLKKDIFDISSSSLLIEGKYDTITSFSVTKWIHLNGGDEKLINFFHKLFYLVKSNGIVILEYQPWKSYENNKSINEHIKQNFNKILIKPDQFEDILVNQIGFIIETRLGCKLSESKGFNRPILVLRRPLVNIINDNNYLDNINSNKLLSDLIDQDTITGYNNNCISFVSKETCNNNTIYPNHTMNNHTIHPMEVKTISMDIISKKRSFTTVSDSDTNILKKKGFYGS